MEDKIVIENESEIKEAGRRLKKIPQFLRKHFFIFFLLFLLLILFLVRGIIGQAVQLRQKATGPGLTPAFYLNPSSLNVIPGQEFQVEVKTNTGGQLISVAAFQISYNSQVLQLTQIAPGSLFPNILRNQINNNIGKASFDAGVALTNPTYYSGDGVLAQLRFKVNSQSPASGQSVAFLLPNPANPKTLGDCDLIGSGTNTGLDLLASVSNLVVKVNLPPTSPSPTLTPSPPVPTNTPTPTTIYCQQVGGVCCPGPVHTSHCENRKFWPGSPYNATQGGCHPSGILPFSYFCCAKCI